MQYPQNERITFEVIDLQPYMIEARGLTRIYSGICGEVDALVGTDLFVPKGTLTAIIGSSGSGKSTLMNILGCLDKPTAGEYLLNGIRTKDLSQKELSELRKQYIGFVFQNFQLIPRLTAEENVALPLLYRGMSRDEIHTRSREMLQRVGLSARSEHRPGDLSGGQMQRVAIARAMVTGPKLLLADEPTGNLDPDATEKILDLLLKCRSDGTTVVLITHDMSVAEKADHVLRISAGRITPA